MKTFRTIALGALAALASMATLTLSPLTAQAQDTSAQAGAAVDVHGDLYDAMNEGIDDEMVLNSLVRQVAEQISQSSPQLATMEAQNPGLVLELIQALRPVMRDFRDRGQRKYEPQFVDILRDLFSDQEAVQLAGFYRSDLGRRLLISVSANVQAEQAIDQALAETDITADALDAGDRITVNRSVGAFMAGLSDEEMEEMASLAVRMPSISRMPEFQQRSLPVRVAMENEPLSAEETRLIEQAVISAFEKYRERTQG
ncbi:hypothetical protein GCM10009127_11230 [Alteraurantiacibacter aestuarii]|uniref:DUF2059 domain-containing protein n=1 Tax=Alteraurantiacibacter aestuarii TaxID=650004 RepID=A0A844ZG66_9SPHN|nr:DUF2059 domain-containing protein [Alteraurantiacibacter aestuarii]MXO87511.1 DUF2059 domain-containing protein [Alteraurantiacibacter aestuarii]